MYFFSVNTQVDEGELGIFEIVTGSGRLCVARGHHRDSGSGDSAHATCSGVAQLSEGNCLPKIKGIEILKHDARLSLLCLF